MDLKDGLKKWKTSHKELDESPDARRVRVEKERREAETRAQEAKARADAAERAAREAAVSDEELFLRAVGAVGDRSGAILKKYDEREGERGVGPGEVSEGKRLSEAQMFLEAVGDVPREGGGKAEGSVADAKRTRRTK